MTIDREKLKALAEITIDIEIDQAPIEGNALASGDDAEGREAEQWVRDQLNSGNEWAWCVVTVRAEYAGCAGADHLGACSYRSEADFKAAGGYYDDMVDCAVEALATDIEDRALAKYTRDELTAIASVWS